MLPKVIERNVRLKLRPRSGMESFRHWPSWYPVDRPARASLFCKLRRDAKYETTQTVMENCSELEFEEVQRDATRFPASLCAANQVPLEKYRIRPIERTLCA